MRRIVITTLLILFAVFIIIQFIHPEKNLSGDNTYSVEKKYPVSDTLKHLLQVACYDCHSNTTEYPWYAEIQPVAWWLADHVKEGKGDLNFSEFLTYPIARQHHKFEEIIELVEEKEMPLNNYTWFGMHNEADISDGQREIIISWAKANMRYLKDNYPPDSLKMNRPPRPVE